MRIVAAHYVALFGNDPELLELRKAGEIALSQAQPFAPIRVSRADDERISEWKVRSA